MNRKLLNSYIKNLKKQGTHLLVRDNTLSLFADLQHAGHVVIKLMLDEDSNLEISEYIGMSNDGSRRTNKITRELERIFREYCFEIENFGYYTLYKPISTRKPPLYYTNKPILYIFLTYIIHYFNQYYS